MDGTFFYPLRKFNKQVSTHEATVGQLNQEKENLTERKSKLDISLKLLTMSTEMHAAAKRLDYSALISEQKILFQQVTYTNEDLAAFIEDFYNAHSVFPVSKLDHSQSLSCDIAVKKMLEQMLEEKEKKQLKKEKKLSEIYKKPVVPGSAQYTYSEQHNYFDFPDLQMTVNCNAKSVFLNKLIIRDVHYFTVSLEKGH